MQEIEKRSLVTTEFLHQISASWTHSFLRLPDLKWENKAVDKDGFNEDGFRCCLKRDGYSFPVAVITPEIYDDGSRFLDAQVNLQISQVRISGNLWGNLPRWIQGSDGKELEDDIKNCCSSNGIYQTGLIAVSLEVWFRRNNWLRSF